MRRLAAALSVALATTASAEDLRIGVAPFFPPFIEPAQSNGGWTGYDAEVMARVCDIGGFDCIYETMPVQALFDALDAGEVDVILGGLGVSAERARRVDFLCPHWEVEGEAYLWAVDPRVSLRNGRIGTTRGTLFEGVLREEGIEATLYATIDDALAGLAAGEIDGILWGGGAMRIGAGYGLSLIETDTIDTPSGGVAFAVTKGEEALRSRLNAALAELSSSGELSRLQVFWMGADQGDVIARCSRWDALS